MESLFAPIPDGQEGIEARSAARTAIDSLTPKPDEAMEDEEKAEAFSHLAELYLRFDDREAAMELMKLTLGFELENSTDIKFEYSNMLAADGRWEEAAESLKAAVDELSSTPYYLYYLVRYGVALERSGQADEAASITRPGASQGARPPERTQADRPRIRRVRRVRTRPRSLADGDQHRHPR